MQNYNIPHFMIIQNNDIEYRIVNKLKKVSTDILSSFYLLDVYFRIIRYINILDIVYKHNPTLKNLIYQYLNRNKDKITSLDYENTYNDDLILVCIMNRDILVIPFMYELSKVLNIDINNLLFIYVKNNKNFIKIISGIPDNVIYTIIKNVRKNILKHCIKRSEISFILVYFYYLLFYISNNYNEEFEPIKSIIFKYIDIPLFPNIPMRFKKVEIKDYNNIYTEFKLIKSITKLGLKDLIINLIEQEDKNNSNQPIIKKYTSFLNEFNDFVQLTLQINEVENFMINLYGLTDNNSYLTLSTIKRLIKVIDEVWK